MVVSIFILLWSHHYHPSQKCFSALKTERLYTLNNSSFPPAIPWKPPFYFLSINLTTVDTLLSGLNQYLLFCDWLISLCMKSSRFIPKVTCVRISFLRLNNILFNGYIIFVYPFIHRWALVLLPSTF